MPSRGCISGLALPILTGSLILLFAALSPRAASNDPDPPPASLGQAITKLDPEGHGGQQLDHRRNFSGQTGQALRDDLPCLVNQLANDLSGRLDLADQANTLAR